MSRERIGFYVCRCGINIASRVRCDEVAASVAENPDVAVSREYLFMCSDPGREMIQRDVAEHGLTRVVVAACSPRMHENTFRAATAGAGLNPYESFHQVCVREHVSWVHADMDVATSKARILAEAGVARVAEQQALQPQTFPVTRAALVVGGGIAGMQAALDIASAGHRVFLVERQPTVGGHMLQYDKTFPTLDCAACIGTPRMVAVGQHPGITLLTWAEVEHVSGFVGNYTVRVRKKARYVRAEACTGCGDCARVCPVDKPGEWDAGMRARQAIFRPFPQAVPTTFVIDKHDRGPCVQTCPAETRAQGWIALIRQGRYEDAVQLMLEHLPFPKSLGRVCPAPCEAKCRRGDVDEPLAIRCLKRFATDRVSLDDLPLPPIPVRDPADRVAVVGGGPAGLSAAFFLARLGWPVTVFEAGDVPGGLLRTGIPAYRLPPAIVEEEVRYLLRLGVEIRTRAPIGAGHTVDDLFAEGFRAVLAAVGAPRETRLHLEGEDAAGVVPGIAFLREVATRGSAPVGRDVIVVGGGAVAIDAARTALRLGAARVRIFYRRTRAHMPAWASEVEAALEEGVEIHPCQAPVRLRVEEGRLVGVVFARTHLLPQGTRGTVRVDDDDLTDVPCDLLLPAIGQQTDLRWTEGTRDLPLDRYGFLRGDPETMATSRPGLFVAGEVHSGPSLVVQAVADGRQAALSIDRFLRGVDLREDRPPRPSGSRWNPLPPGIGRHPRALPQHLPLPERRGFAEVEQTFDEDVARREAARCVDCGSCAECGRCVSTCQAHAVDHAMKDEVVDLEVGAIVLATGFQPMDPTPIRRLGWGRLANVFTHLEFERMVNATGPTAGRILLRDPADRLRFTAPPRAVAILHCVGSRDRNHHAWCSRTCCMAALKYAHLLKDRLGEDVEVYETYIDMRCFGKGYEEFYQRVQEEGVHFVRGKAAEVTDVAEADEEQGRLVVIVEDTLSHRLLRLPVDMVVLATAMEPQADAAAVARTFGVTIGADGYFLEEHPKLEPVSTATAGVFVAGACQGPKDIPDAVAQARAAASAVQALLTRGEVEVAPILSSIDPEICAGCEACIGLCPYTAIRYDPARRVSVVQSALCKGCGSCAAHCPSGAASVGHFTDRQVFAEIEGLLGGARKP